MNSAHHEEFEVSREEIEARAREMIEHRYVDGARRWRSPRNAAILVATMLIYGAAPFVPEVAVVTGAPPAASLSVMALMALVAVLATVAMRMWHPLHVSYRLLSMAETVVWVTGAMVLIALSGSVRNWYWVHLGFFVLGMSTVVYRQRAYLFLVGGNVAGVAIFFLATDKLGDGLMAALVGFSVMIFQRASTMASRRAEEAHARSELIAERAGAALAQAERDRIARDLHDGLEYVRGDSAMGHWFGLGPYVVVSETVDSGTDYTIRFQIDPP